MMIGVVPRRYRHDVDTIGDWLELSGTLVTFYGLWFAWNRNSNRRLRQRITRSTEYIINRTKHFLAVVFPCLRRSAAVVVSAAEASAAANNATVSVRSAVDPGRPVLIQIQQLAGQFEAISNDIHALRQRIDQVEATGRSQRTRAEKAAVQAIADLRASSKIDAFTDLSIALSGILITATGIVFGMVAEGRFSWLPWG
ncbi:hypothetical protein ACIBG0_41935 [Nocardia sp. NPDC050630]|uniref:hypothetical protein n=1 Tax=Nocardia sp. NPDC050630 TaxID=3364321 RepID=UPI0037B8C7C7